MKKTPGNIIILHMCNKIHDHMLYCSWDMARDRCNYFSSWAIFCHFTFLTAWKIKIFKKWKRKPEATIILQSVPKIMIICYTVPEIWHVTDVIVIFHFGLFFAPFPPNSPKNQIFLKMKKPGNIIILHVSQKLWSDDVQFLRHGTWQTDRQTDGWMDEQMMDGKSGI